MPVGPAPLDAFPLDAPDGGRPGPPAHTRSGRELFADARGTGLRASWHPDRGVVVLSMWKRDVCTGTFHLPIEEAARLASFLGATDPGGVGPADTGSDDTVSDDTGSEIADRTVPLRVLRDRRPSPR